MHTIRHKYILKTHFAMWSSRSLDVTGFRSFTSLEYYVNINRWSDTCRKYMTGVTQPNKVNAYIVGFHECLVSTSYWHVQNTCTCIFKETLKPSRLYQLLDQVTCITTLSSWDSR